MLYVPLHPEKRLPLVYALLVDNEMSSTTLRTVQNQPVTPTRTSANTLLHPAQVECLPAVEAYKLVYSEGVFSSRSRYSVDRVAAIGECDPVESGIPSNR